MEKKEVIITNSIASITNLLEARITVLMNEFTRLEQELNTQLITNEVDIDEIKDPKTMGLINELLDIFFELKPIERLIRYKYQMFNKIFDQLSVIEAERVHGKFFSFLLCLPNRRTYIKKNKFIERSLIGTSEIK